MDLLSSWLMAVLRTVSMRRSSLPSLSLYQNHYVLSQIIEKLLLAIFFKGLWNVVICLKELSMKCTKFEIYTLEYGAMIDFFMSL